jgi:hypothetical protein
MTRRFHLVGLGLLFLGCAPSHQADQGKMDVVTEANFKSEVLDKKGLTLVYCWQEH